MAPQLKTPFSLEILYSHLITHGSLLSEIIFVLIVIPKAFRASVRIESVSVLSQTTSTLALDTQ